MAAPAKPYPELPEWANDDVTDPISGQNNVTPPTATQITEGYKYKEYPSRQKFNWMGRVFARWVSYFAGITDLLYNRGHWVNIEPPGGLMPGFNGVTVEGLPETGATDKDFIVSDINLFRRQLVSDETITTAPTVVSRPSTEIFGNITIKPVSADSFVILLPWAFFGVAPAIGMHINKGVAIYGAYLDPDLQQRPATITTNATGLYISLDNTAFPFNPSAGTGIDTTIYFNIQAIKDLS